MSRTRKPKLGPTGDFPSGKFVPSDKGGLRLAVTHDGGKVIVRFGSPVAWLGMDPEDALALADLLRKHAMSACTGGAA